MIYEHMPAPTIYEQSEELATLRTKLAAAEARAERFARWFVDRVDCRTCRNYSVDGCIQTALCVDADGYRRALPVRFWVATHSAALALKGPNLDAAIDAALRKEVKP